MSKSTATEVTAIRLRWRGAEHIAAWRRMSKESRERVVAEFDDIIRAESDDDHRADALEALAASHEGEVLQAPHADLGRLLEIIEQR